MRLPLCAMLSTLAALAQEKPPEIPRVRTSVVITGTVVEPSVDQRNQAVFQDTLFSRDDQIFHQLAAGINAGQHEGGGKSIEIRRFGFNLDHGGVNGGLKVLVDNVQQNQSTQGHGQGYLGSLKSLSPELVQEANLINGPFSAEYGDFSGLGVVHIRTREFLPEQWTARLQGGSFHTQRGFLAYSPDLKHHDAFLAYEGSHSDGPFRKPLQYRRDNVTGNWTRRLSSLRSYSLKLNGGRHGFDSSGQIPLSEVAAGRLDRFGFLDPGDGGRARQGVLAGYYRQESSRGAVWKLDGFVSRSLFDLYSNFTFFLNDPAGDAIQQHDSRLQQGSNAQYTRPHELASLHGLFAAGANFHASQINVGLYPRIGRTPLGVTTQAHARVTNGAGYLQDAITLWHGKLQVSGGLRYDVFRFDVQDRVNPRNSGADVAGRWQPKLNAALTPWQRSSLTLHFNYGRGISSLDARSLIQQPAEQRVANTDFSQLGVAQRWGRVSVSSDFFLINRSHELVYVPDDGSLEFLGPSRSHGFEAKTSVQVTRHVTLHGGLTKVLNAFYRGTAPRAYIDRAPHFTMDSGLTVARWHGWSGSARLRAISRYRLNGEGEDFAVASGNTVADVSVARQIRRGLEFHVSVDNAANRRYFETQNYIESCPRVGLPSAWGIHATPGYPLTLTMGVTMRFRESQRP
ncbi:MAG: TonB-dependent receptor [Bryobacteraceae bacterium]|nr:TonB-dependent receptor [Bryobacteraceae bacterium]